jgi:hypothetical protein
VKDLHFSWLTERFAVQLADWRICGSAGRLEDLWVSWLTERFVAQLADWMIYGSAG